MQQGLTTEWKSRQFDVLGYESDKTNQELEDKAQYKEEKSHNKKGVNPRVDLAYEEPNDHA